MADESEPQYVDSSRLKQVNLELGGLASKHKACRLNSGAFSALGAVVLSISLLGLIHLFPAGASDWTQNPNSPVYELAAQNEQAFVLKSMAVAVGFATGLAFLYTARSQCTKQRGLWQQEDDLRREMRHLRDRLYVVGQMHAVREPDPKRQVGQTAPLEPDEARGEYVGVYNPPASRRDHGPEHA
ncbi:MAG: hypothetical protein KDI77_10040 [Gammaproteobacteria bacterium]|nr:hypothetical protein [Gammaproteobacteria bacterium]MCP5435925.1 hypothetical protein [Chromatiaceae bacterium]